MGLPPDFEIEEQPQRFQCAAIFQQVRFVDHENRVATLRGIRLQHRFQPPDAFFDRVPRRIGRGRPQLLGQVHEHVAAGHLRKHHVHLRPKRVGQLVTKQLHEHRFADARRAGQHGSAAAVLHRVTQLQERRLVRLAGEKLRTVGARLKWFFGKLPVVEVHVEEVDGQGRRSGAEGEEYSKSFLIHRTMRC